MTDFSLTLKSKEQNYKIVIDNFSIEDLKSKLKENLSCRKVLVVISQKVEKLYGKILFPLFDDEISVYKYVLPDGEKHKNFKNFEKILNFALKNGLSRKDCIIAIGGGVVGDLTGFVASTYMRGIDLIQIPTTLLACVDSSVGGKTAIDTAFGKNLVGAFYQPKTVIINTNFLKTLDEKQFKTGLGEVIKYAFIEKSCNLPVFYNLMDFINQNFEKIMAKDTEILQKIIEICVSLKISVVEQDEKEADLRRILNFGHTIGHAIEKITNYKKYTHGEAIVQGMIFIFEYAHKHGLIDENYKNLALGTINKFHFKNVKMPPLSKLIPLIKMDKKSTNSGIAFILPSGYAEVITKDIMPESL